MGLISEALVSVAEVKEYIEQISGTGMDALLERLINASSLKIKDALQGHLYIQETATEDYTGSNKPGKLGGARRLWLKKSPIVSVTSITDDDGTTIASSDYTIVAQEGYLEHDWYWPAPTYRWTIVYTAGEATSATGVPEKAKLACTLEVAALMQARKKPGAMHQHQGSRGSSRTVIREKPHNPAGLLSDEAYTLIEPDIRHWV